MEDKYYLMRERSGIFKYSPCLNFTKHEDLKILAHPIKKRILNTLYKTPMYSSELAAKLKIHEQKLYYHINQMIKAGILDVVEKKEIRGTTAKKLQPGFMNFSYSNSKVWSSLQKSEMNDKLGDFLKPFISEGEFNGNFVVGSPDPHGPYKGRARDGHYAIDLALFLGNFITISNDFTVRKDVDCSIKDTNRNLILVGGPVTNQVVSEINSHLPVQFSEGKAWEIYSKKTKTKYREEANGLIARIKNPFDENKYIIVLAGITTLGTKSAVIAFRRNYNSLLTHFNESDSWGAVISGFDLDGDGKIDSVEILE